jgi:hypothetical protein
MYSPLVAPDGSLDRLRAAGRRFAIRENYLVIAVPHLNGAGELRRGFIADPINLLNETDIGPPGNHQMYFIGEEPYDLTGASLVPVLGGGANQTAIFDGYVSSFYFSHKLQTADGQNRNYVSVAEKFEQHYRTIAGPAVYRFAEADGPFLDVDFGSDIISPFCFPDTFSAHAELNGLNARLKPLTVGIIGLGGTGAYVLDFLSKTPVKLIRMFDDDEYAVKNAFRSPGTSNSTDFKKFKVDLYAERYSSFRLDVVPHSERITRENRSLVEDCDFIFVCVDKAASRAAIVDVLCQLGKPFIDVGMGLNRTSGGLDGGLRATLVDEQTRALVVENATLPTGEDAEDLYQTNIQIAELNALNATLAVMLFKMRYGFYGAAEPVYNVLMNLGKLKLFTQAAV